MRKHRHAFSRVDLLVVLGLFLGVLGVLLPAVGRARAAAKEEDTVNNLKQLGLAIHNFADTNAHLPPGFDDNHISTAAYLLPFLEQEKLHKQVRFDRPFDDKANEEVRKTVVKVFVDPDDKAEAPGGKADPTKRFGPTNYLFNGLVFSHNSKGLFPATFPDGTSNTVITAQTLRGDGSKKATDVKRQHIALTARAAAGYKGGKRDDMGVQEFKEGKFVAADRGSSWLDGRLLQGTFVSGRVPNDPRPDVVVGAPERMDGLSGPRSLSDTVQAGLADGSVHKINAKKITAQTWYHVQTPAGGEVLGNDW
jgi:hypothetical protein